MGGRVVQFLDPVAAGGEHGAVEQRCDHHDEGDVGEHARHIHALGELDDVVAEAGQRSDDLAADDGEKRDGESHAQPGENHRQCGGNEHVTEQLIVGSAHGFGRGD